MWVIFVTHISLGQNYIGIQKSIVIVIITIINILLPHQQNIFYL